MINGHKVAAVIVLHFGLDYLPYAMHSVADAVDEYIVQYSPEPSHGHGTTMRCPETFEQLRAVTMTAIEQINKPLRWHTGHWNSEGDQFKEGMSRTDAEIIIKLDCDEVWYPGLLQSAIEQGLERGKHEMRLSLWHYWRSLKKAFTHDPAAPGRIYFRMFADGESTYNKPKEVGEWWTIHHYGYAFGAELTRYKMEIHGHRAQFKTSPERWYNEVYLTNRQTDVHPCGSDYWMQTEDVPVMVSMRAHPFAGLEVIP